MNAVYSRINAFDLLVVFRIEQIIRTTGPIVSSSTRPLI